MKTKSEPCFICLDVNTKSFEKSIHIQSIQCDCKVHAHRECWSEYCKSTNPIKCPICHLEVVENPMTKACQVPLELQVSAQRVKREYHPSEDPGIQAFVCCCSSYLCLIGIIGAVLG